MSATATSIPVQKGRHTPPVVTRIRSPYLERVAPYAYIAPFFVIFIIFGLFPLVFTFYVALFDWNPIGEQTFVGFANFERLWQDDRFWNATVNTFGIFLLSTIPQLAFALFIAHLLNHATLRWANFFRMALLIPFITSVAATALVFSQIFDKNFGLINWVLGWFGIDPVNFMATQVGSWVVISSMVVLEVVRLQRAPLSGGPPVDTAGDVEAASVDGAVQLAAVHPPDDSVAAPDHRLHGDHVDDRRAADLHGAASGDTRVGHYVRRRPAVPDARAVPLRAGLRPVRVRLRIGDRRRAVRDRRGRLDDQLLPVDPHPEAPV